MYLRMRQATDERRLERGRKAKRETENKAPINLPEPKAAPDARFPAQRAFADGKIRTFNGKEWL